MAFAIDAPPAGLAFASDTPPAGLAAFLLRDVTLSQRRDQALVRSGAADRRLTHPVPCSGAGGMTEVGEGRSGPTDPLEHSVYLQP